MELLSHILGSFVKHGRGLAVLGIALILLRDDEIGEASGAEQEESCVYWDHFPLSVTLYLLDVIALELLEPQLLA